MSVLPKWYAAVVVVLLREEHVPVEWSELHIGAERVVNCEHMQALLTSIPQAHSEWQQDRREDWVPGFFKYQTTFVTSLDVRTAFDMAEPSVVSRVLTSMEVQGHAVAALFEEMKDLRSSACCENCETEFGYPERGCPNVMENSCRICAVEKLKKHGRPRGLGWWRRRW